jgi:DNA-binding MarR family transcriptional regulator
MNDRKKPIFGLREELGLRRPIEHPAHEPLLGIVYTATLLAKHGGRLLRAHGLTDAQFNVLMILHHQGDNGRLSQARLGQLLLVNRSNVTGLVDRMERDGIVRREDDPEDRRINLVAITEAGERVMQAAKADYYPMVEAVMGGLDENDRVELIQLLGRVRAGLRGGAE